MKSPGSKSKVFIIGGRRGLGKHVAEQWVRERSEDLVITSSRSAGADELCDLSREESVSELLNILDREQPERVFCVAGGGPYGKFSSKEWKDHSWGLSVTMLAPMRITHHLLRSAYCEQIILVGSAIAESSADPNAASYCAAKHGLKGFVSTLAEEVSDKDIRLFSPGYMATEIDRKSVV